MLAPVATRTDDPPSQIVDGEATHTTVGNEITITVTEAELEQPLISVPVTVYVLVRLGLTEMLAAASPVLHK